MRSDTVKKGFQRAPHRGLLHACGLADVDINKPFIGVANSFCEVVPGHVHLNKVAATGRMHRNLKVFSMVDGIL